MNPGTIVVAVGGNALSPPGKRVTIAEQFRHTRESLDVVVALAGQGWRIVLVHGNGPQVGQALTRNELALDVVEPLPLGVLVAATAGWIGYMIQQSLQNAFRRAGIDREVLTIITQTRVDRTDPALTAASKPIGNVLEPDRASRLAARGVPIGTDAAGHHRRLAPSPTPRNVVETEALRRWLDTGTVLVAAGGGGPPVYVNSDGDLEGIDAVVDKDRAAAVLGVGVGADTFLILTDVEAVFRNWGMDDAQPISRLTVDEARTLVTEGHAAVGSMGPKLEAAIDFLRGGGRRAIIAALADGVRALRGETGTTILGEV